ncbi:MAG: hypothetical protein ABSF28_20940 [Terracidiphilus sp.]
MGSGFGLSNDVGFLYVWPLTFLATAALWVCTGFTKTESLDGILTDGGKRMIRSRVFLGIGCAIYYLCIALGVAFKSIDEPLLVLGFWDEHWHAFLTLILVAEVANLIAMIYGFRARGNRSWILQIATVLVVISSTFLTFVFLFPN